MNINMQTKKIKAHPQRTHRAPTEHAQSTHRTPTEHPHSTQITQEHTETEQPEHRVPTKHPQRTHRAPVFCILASRPGDTLIHQQRTFKKDIQKGNQKEELLTLSRVSAPGAQNCDPYGGLLPLELKIATTVEDRCPWSSKLRPLSRIVAPGAQNCDPC